MIKESKQNTEVAWTLGFFACRQSRNLLPGPNHTNTGRCQSGTTHQHAFPYTINSPKLMSYLWLCVNVQTLFQWYFFSCANYKITEKVSFYIRVWEPFTIKLHLIVYTLLQLLKQERFFYLGTQSRLDFYQFNSNRFLSIRNLKWFNQILFIQCIGKIQFVKPRTNLCQCHSQHF